jgi:hypothetical protein
MLDAAGVSDLVEKLNPCAVAKHVDARRMHTQTRLAGSEICGRVRVLDPPIKKQHKARLRRDCGETVCEVKLNEVVFGKSHKTRVKVSRAGITPINRTYFSGDIDAAVVNGPHRLNYVLETK